MRTQSEIKKNNIRKANLLKEHNHRTNRGTMNTKFGLYEQCGGAPRDTEGVYMGAPAGTEPMMDNNMGMEFGVTGDESMGMMFPDQSMMMGGDMMGMDDDDMPMDMDMGMMGGDQSMMMGDDTMGMDDDDMPMNDEMMMMFMNEEDDDVIGVDEPESEEAEAKYDKEEIVENYKAFTAKPKRDSWGNEYNQILTENTQVSGVNSLIHRMKNVIK